MNSTPTAARDFCRSREPPVHDAVPGPLGPAGEELDTAIGVMRAAAARAGRDPAEISLVLGATLRRSDEAELDRARGLGADRMVLSASRRATSMDLVIGEMAECSKRLGH